MHGIIASSGSLPVIFHDPEGKPLAVNFHDPERKITPKTDATRPRHQIRALNMTLPHMADLELGYRRVFWKLYFKRVILATVFAGISV